MMIHSGSSYGVSTPITGSISTVNYTKDRQEDLSKTNFIGTGVIVVTPHAPWWSDSPF